MATKRILSGMRPTGKLHLGHLVGALENWVSLQSAYSNYHLIADYHALTTNLDSSELENNSLEMVIDWLSAGIDPNKSILFRHSQIKEHAELHLIFSMLITTSRLERNPTLKEQVRDLSIENMSYGHLGYPVLQSADILLYKGEVVPVGDDQLPHLEITRDIARKFNNQYGKVFPEAEPLITKFSRLPGLDGGQKMSKSLNNTILISDNPENVITKMKSAVTDPLKIKRNDPGRPDVCTVFTYHTKFNSKEEKEIRGGCESGTLGCVECKLKCAAAVSNSIAPIVEKRIQLEKSPATIWDILNDGETKARKVAEQTMQEVRSKMKLGILK
ncbi:MAG: tryptophan--tRNA ligase [Ignavibacteria bacterium]|nr:tryptophan--tRNA ligase [Bacteroidota bacterium]MSQ45928.1 tryptophan--tRNA ligase [Ignavibacteria bacterium]